MRQMQGVAGWRGPPRGDRAAARPSRLLRLASFAAACALSVALLVMLSSADVRITEPPIAAGAAGIVMLQQRPPPQPSPLRAIRPHPHDGSRKPPSGRAAAIPATAAISPPAQAPVASDTPSITPPEPPASAPLRLDGSVLRQAAGQSKSAVQQLADGSGNSLDTPRATASEKLAAGVESAVKPDCLAPAVSLLDLPIRIFQAATQRCKVN